MSGPRPEPSTFGMTPAATAAQEDSPASVEPPRKRQRTTDTTSAANAACGTSTVTTLPSPDSPVASDSAVRITAIGGVNELLMGASSSYENGENGGGPNAKDGHGDDDARHPNHMKGPWKGKVKEGASSQGTNQDSQNGEMLRLSEGGASSITKHMHLATSPANGEREDDLSVRDNEFYIDSADCVIRVENTLFRVHRYFLGRDSSAFQHMFSMPIEGIPSCNMEGYSDENPIRLYGESVERFRALLSVIYDLPLQLQVYNTPAANVDRLLTIAEMTNKYHFASIETWAVDALHNVISGLHGHPQSHYDLNYCSSAWMKRVLEVALLCGHTPLRDRVAERWVERIVARDLRPIHALEIADRSGLKRLQGYAYYVQLLEMGEDFDPGVTEDGKQYARSRIRMGSTATPLVQAAAPAGPDEQARGKGTEGAGTPAVLSREQKQRLLSGHWSLTRLWEELRATPPTFQQPDGCTYHQHGCLRTWAQVWRDVGKGEHTLRCTQADVLGRLRAMDEQLVVHADLSCALTPQCKRGALLALKRTVREVQEGLAGHFADLTAEDLASEQGEEEA